VEKLPLSTTQVDKLVAGAAIAHNSAMEQTPRQQFPAIATLEDAPFSAIAGLNVEVATEGAVTVRMPFHPRLLNYGPPNVPIHGGAIATLADFAACAAVWTMPQTSNSATVSLTVNYSAPGIQSDLIAKAVVRRAGKRVASLTVEICDNRGTLVADALVTYKIA
jgi:uncharacterized protein (TIGR00369 family)